VASLEAGHPAAPARPAYSSLTERERSKGASFDFARCTRSAEDDTGGAPLKDDTEAWGRSRVRSRMARFGVLQGWGGCASIDFRTDRRSVFLMLW
jgi:hypothetical protein